nr:G protein-coupled receptor [Proales similis]
MDNNGTVFNSTGAGQASGPLTREDQLLIIDIRLFVYGYTFLPLAIIGLALNGFTILVLLHPKMRNFSTNAYLTALSIANIVCLVNFFFLYSIRYMLSSETFKRNLNAAGDSQEVPPYESFINYIYGIWSPIFTTFQLFAIYLTCAVTVDRWIYLTWPLKVDKICSMRNTIRAIVLLFVFCVLYNLPRWFEIESQLKEVRINNQTSTFYQARVTQLGSTAIYQFFMQQYGYMIFVYGIPFVVLLLANIGIIKKLVEAKKRKSNLLGGKGNARAGGARRESGTANEQTTTRGRGSSSVRPDPKVTLMVLAVVLAFFLSQFPYLLLRVFSNPKVDTVRFHIAKVFCDLLAAINCCVNFLIYCVFGQNFRQISKGILLNPSLRPYAQQYVATQKNASRNAQATKRKDEQTKTECVKLQRRQEESQPLKEAN